DDLARAEVTGGVLRKIAHNPATSEDTLECLIELDQRWLTFPVTRRRDLSPEFIDGIARRLTDRNAIFHASSAPNADPETLRYLAAHPSAPMATVETVAQRLATWPLSVAYPRCRGDAGKSLVHDWGDHGTGKTPRYRSPRDLMHSQPPGLSADARNRLPEFFQHSPMLRRADLLGVLCVHRNAH